ncbi:hypothetical protein T265_02195 [Opisthorchis viverrini]|uniref:Uncharacterized protein n=1 Tax=Opisthorchis viverrini TaxID=6198 RepID=A0A074ZWQ4_OPIVI|nr:hypothetical protein T265_02195 [Opisthorchis viverrini]KER31551.1 hypothetical protein T265_02195 [Opisthorchis viverrini]
MQRIKEHNAAVRRHDALSLICKYEDREGHKFNLENAKILAFGDMRHGREFLEAWHSMADEINRCIGLFPIYVPLRAKDQHLNRNTKEGSDIVQLVRDLAIREPFQIYRSHSKWTEQSPQPSTRKPKPDTVVLERPSFASASWIATNFSKQAGVTVTLGPAPVEELYRTVIQKVHEADSKFVPKHSTHLDEPQAARKDSATSG